MKTAPHLTGTSQTTHTPPTIIQDIKLHTINVETLEGNIETVKESGDNLNLPWTRPSTSPLKKSKFSRIFRRGAKEFSTRQCRDRRDV